MVTKAPNARVKARGAFSSGPLFDKPEPFIRGVVGEGCWREDSNLHISA